MKFILNSLAAIASLASGMDDRRFRIFEKPSLLKSSSKSDVKSGNTLSQKGRRKRHRQYNSQSFKKGRSL
jgi:hypothetical protein